MPLPAALSTERQWNLPTTSCLIPSFSFIHAQRDTSTKSLIVVSNKMMKKKNISGELGQKDLRPGRGSYFVEKLVILSRV